MSGMKPSHLFLPLMALATALFPAMAQARSTSLENLLVVFADGKDLTAYQSIPGVTWRMARIPTGDTRQRFDWRGELRLAGLGEVSVPRGIGADNRAVKANEGDSRLSMHGDTTIGVSHIMAVKYHATADYAALLRAQLSSGGKVTLLAENCWTDSHAEAPDSTSLAYYRLDLAGVETPVYAEVSRDSIGTRYSPGETWLVFRKTTLQREHFDQLGCTVPDAG